MGCEKWVTFGVATVKHGFVRYPIAIGNCPRCGFELYAIA